MNGYVESGYVVTLVSLGVYGASLVVRQRAARRRLPATGGATDAARPDGPEADPMAES